MADKHKYHRQDVLFQGWSKKCNEPEGSSSREKQRADDRNDIKCRKLHASRFNLTWEFLLMEMSLLKKCSIYALMSACNLAKALFIVAKLNVAA